MRKRKLLLVELAVEQNKILAKCSLRMVFPWCSSLAFSPMFCTLLGCVQQGPMFVFPESAENMHISRNKRSELLETRKTFI